MRDTQELSTGQIVQVAFRKPANLPDVVYNGAIIREIDRDSARVYVALTETHSQWVAVDEIEIPR